MNHNHQQPDWLDDTRQTIAHAVETHGRIALFYSGGAESSLLLHLVTPWREKTTVYTVRTGAEFPHMVDFIDRKLEGWAHRVISTDLAASLGELGLPAAAVPIEHVQGISQLLGGEDKLPRIVPWPFCCIRNRWHPGCDAIKADGFAAAIHGQRADDFPKGTAKLEHPGLELVAPLWVASRGDVLAAVERLGVELPDHYGAVPSSLDCSVCPASLTKERRAWMAVRYPKELEAAEGLHTVVRDAVLASLDSDNTSGPFSRR